MNQFETRTSMSMKMYEDLFPCTWQISTSGKPVTDKLLKNIPLLFLGFVFNIKESILKHCSREFSEPMAFSTELRRNYKRRGEYGRNLSVPRG